MFTGIVQTIGEIKYVGKIQQIFTIRVKFSSVNLCKIGDSVAINGVCLTIVEVNDDLSATFELVTETLEKTNLKSLKVGGLVNVELAARYGDFIGGHMVQGHVDNVGKITHISENNQEWLVTIATDEKILDMMAPKGFIAIDGMSITVVNVMLSCFSVTFIPHTIDNTIVKCYKVDDIVNLEVDIFNKQAYFYIKKYIHKQ